MSGFAGIVHFDGRPVDPELLLGMTKFLAPRGPDRQEIWIGQNAGLGHALLRTTSESAGERQPFTVDGEAWIAADCRVDDRTGLIDGLARGGSPPAADATDPELILRAYLVWQDDCCEHLLGDFSFAIWDARRRRLFCARDHFGVKPFFYAPTPSALIVGNDLSGVRAHPAVTNVLDDLAIADFLVYGYGIDSTSTSFKDIRRLPAAHTLVAEDGRLEVRRYWRIPMEDELRYRSRGEYVEQFLDLLSTSVRDRLRTSAVSVLMSGGLDSPTVTAVAHRVLRASGRAFDLRAHTIVFDRIVPDEERKYSQLVATHIGVPIHHYPFDDAVFPPREPEPDWYPPEPRFLFDRSRAIEVNRGPASHARVLFRADGADPLIDGGSSVERLFAAGKYGRLAKEFLWLWAARGQPPRIGLRQLVLRKLLGRQIAPPGVQPYPDWLDPSLEREFDLRARWRALNAVEHERPGLELGQSYWPWCIEAADPGTMRLPAEIRYPFLDLRLARFLLRVPPLPWATQKSLLRIAMKGLLPREVLQRPKAPLAGNPWAALLPPAASAWWRPDMRPGDALERYVQVPRATTALEAALRAAQTLNRHDDIDLLRQSLRPLSLNLWLRQTVCANFPLAAQARARSAG